MQTMRNVADSGGESGFNLEGLVSFSTYAVGVIGVLIGRFFFGLDWTVAAFDRRSQLYTYGLADESCRRPLRRWARKRSVASGSGRGRLGERSDLTA